MMRRFEIDPTIVADALREGRKLIVEIDPSVNRYAKVTLGDVSPYFKQAKQAQQRIPHE